MTNVMDKTIAERAVYHANKYRQLLTANVRRADLHRAASDFFYMATLSLDNLDVAGATYRYRQGVKYAAEARR